MNRRTCVWALLFAAALWARSNAATIHDAADKETALGLLSAHGLKVSDTETSGRSSQQPAAGNGRSRCREARALDIGKGALS